MKILQINKVKKNYEKDGKLITALKSISLSLNSKDFVVAHGPSGCGKTTLLLTAGGLLQPDSGEVLLDNKDIYSLSAEKRASLRAGNIGFVFQQFNLIPYLTVKENILSASINAPVKYGKERAGELLKYLELEKRANHHPSELSVGEKQRVALARAVFNKPKLILADEPTGNLDEKNSEKVVSFLKQFAKEGGAVLLVTHSRKIIKESRKTISLKPGGEV